MAIKFKVKMTEKAMYDFMLYHNYSRLSGIIQAVTGAAILILAAYRGISGSSEGIMLWVGVGLLLLFMTPISLKMSAKNQVKNTKMFQEPLHYEISEEGVSVSQNGETAVNAWEEFAKAVSTEQSLILYITRVRAIILPKESMGDDYMAVVEMISTHMPANKVKIRHVR